MNEQSLRINKNENSSIIFIVNVFLFIINLHSFNYY
jgi:hypothetical protein